MFTITCKDCAARIRVRHAVAIGQVLACPKCGEMLHIQPPEGWRPTEADAKAQPQGTVQPEDLKTGMAASPASHLASSDFDDIEALLAKSPLVDRSAAQARAKSAAAILKTAAQGKPHSSRPANAPVARSSEPSMAPSTTLSSDRIKSLDQWTAPAIKHRQRLILIGAVALFCLVTVFIITVYALRPKSNSSVVQKGNVEQDSGPMTAPRADPGTPIQGGEVALPNDRENEVVDGRGGDGENNQGNETGESDPGNSVADGASSPLGDEPPPGAEIAPVDSSPAHSIPTHIAPSTSRLFGEFVPSVASRPREDEISMLLNRMRTSIADLRIAANRAVPVTLGGIPPFYLERIEPRDRSTDLETILAVRIASVEYRDVMPLAIFRELGLMLNLPVTVDPALVDARGMDWNRPIFIQGDQLTLGQWLQMVAEKAEVAVANGQHGMVITLADMDVPSTRTYQLPPLADVQPEAGERFAEALKLLIAPGTWGNAKPADGTDPIDAILARIKTGEGDQESDQEFDQPGDRENASDDLTEHAPINSPFTAGEIRVSGNQLTVTHTGRVHLEIETFLEKLRAAQAVASGSPDDTSWACLQTRWRRLAPRLEEPIKVSPAIETQIDLYFQRLGQGTGTWILIDWEALYEAGWGMQTVLPSTLRGENWNTLLAHLEHASGLVLSARTSEVGQLTTEAALAQRQELEIYPVNQLLARGIQPNQLEELLWQVMNWHWVQGKGRHFLYEPNYQCLIVVAPQRLQRQFEAVLDQLARTSD